MMRKLKWLLPWLALASVPAAAQLLTTNVGPGSFGGSAVLVSCPSTGIYDLSNTCNDIYFIGALK